MKKFVPSEFAAAMNIPEVIELNQGDVTLRLVGCAVDEINYEIDAKYPFKIKGDTDETRMVDFAGGRMIIPGDVIEDLTVVGIHEAYDGKEYYVVFENPEPKKFKEYQMKKN